MNEKGICPVCNGTGRMPTPDNLRKYGESQGWYGYSKDDDCCTCTNCGGQTMSGHATGMVSLNKEGLPCVHEYTHYLAGRCYHRYTCKHCNEVYYIDSGD